MMHVYVVAKLVFASSTDRKTPFSTYELPGFGLNSKLKGYIGIDI